MVLVETGSYGGAWLTEQIGTALVTISEILMDEVNFSSTSITFDRLLT